MGREKASQACGRNEALEAVLRSGYLLESRVETLLQEHGCYAEANSAYPDPHTGKSRELDVSAISAWPCGPSEFDHIFAVALAECVNNPQPLAFIVKDTAGFLLDCDIKSAGIPVQVQYEGRGGGWMSLVEYLDMKRYHHYCGDRVATQYCSFVQKKGKSRAWMATHEQAQADCFQKLCDAVEYERDKLFKGYMPGPSAWVNVEFYYPMVVVQGELLECRPTKRSARLVSTDWVRFRRTQIIDQEAETYQIDVVTERHLPRLLDLIEGEMKKTARLLRRRSAKIQRASEHLKRSVRRLTSPEKIRRALEF